MKQRRRSILVVSVVLALLVLIGLLIRCQLLPGDRFLAAESAARNLSPGRSDTVPMLILQVQKCSKLYTAEYRVHKIVTHDDALRLKGQLMSKQFNLKVPLADRKIAIPMDAKIKAYIDFSEFSEQNIERSGNQITIILPDPQVVMTSSKIDQKNVKQYVGLTRAHFSDEELANYQQQGREAILQSIPDMGIEETARANAAKVLVPMLTQLGYEEQDITIAFRKDLDFRHKYQGLIRFED
ncbi:Protein of unknown function [Xylanibacter ruminicola]|uniref:DUF4230 domain-containing protein n=1 Tax=Xylanibacter ruminicola TaxID=839 RepID=UPI0008E43137|nr:DUF4230 domain-containing protein [Xylanibacter ruminicola]SFC56858.1 Protein of unknown function [Xylanibacter ruminicola]